YRGVTLQGSFLGAWKGAAPGSGFALEETAGRAREAWPGVVVEDEAFGRWLAERAPVELAPEAALAKLRGDDLSLACALAAGNAAALRHFDERFLSRVPIYLARLRADSQLVADTRQAIRERLFLSDGETGARIARYSGLGALDAWVRVVAVRVAINLG